MRCLGRLILTAVLFCTGCIPSATFLTVDDQTNRPVSVEIERWRHPGLMDAITLQVDAPVLLGSGRSDDHGRITFRCIGSDQYFIVADYYVDPPQSDNDWAWTLRRVASDGEVIQEKARLSGGEILIRIRR